MGVVGEALDDVFSKIEDFVSFFIIYSIIIFVAGQWFGVIYKGKSLFDWPLYLLFIALALYVIKGWGKGGKKKK